jgi:hypothetical protein
MSAIQEFPLLFQEGVGGGKKICCPGEGRQNYPHPALRATFSQREKALTCKVMLKGGEP